MTINLINYALAKKDWEKAYEDLKVLEKGGRNLLPYSQLLRYIGGNVYDDALTSYYSISGNKIIATKQPKNSSLPGWTLKLTENIEITISGETDLTSTMVCYYSCFASDGTITKKQTLFTFAPSNGRFTVTRTLSIPDGTAYINIGIGSETVENYWIQPKLEKGNKPTDWTPAPEDINAHPFVAELAETVYRSKQNEERIRNLENALTALGGGS